MVVLAVEYAGLHAVFPCLSFAAFRRPFLDLSLTGLQMMSTSDRCTGSTGDPQQFSPELLATGQESSTVVQAEPVKLVTAKLMLLLLTIVRLPGRVIRWATKGPNIQLNI